MIRYLFIFLLGIFFLPAAGQNTLNVSIDTTAESVPVTPLLYGQFIEHLGRCIDGGIYDPGNPLSDERGFRTDVLEKVKGLDVPLLRFPGGTVTKIYHWEYGVGPMEQRPKRPNLIWGGNIEYGFGTTEFIAYCREIGAEPMLVVNMATGTPEEAAHWVEYCNGTGDTYYANLRRTHGYPEPFGVKYWGIGNEESAEADAGRHQDVDDYIEDTWQFVKLMKLTDPGIELVMSGDTRDRAWNQAILDRQHAVTDYLAVHFYAVPSDTTFGALLKSVYQYEDYLDTLRAQLAEVPPTGGLSRWYRFDGRQRPLKLAIDEWGIWYIDSPRGRGTYGLEFPYDWTHALGTAAFLHTFYRNADIIGLATWAQTVNVLAPIMTTPEGSYVQPVYTPLAAYRAHMLPNYLPVTQTSVGRADVVATRSDDGTETVVAIVNLDLEEELNVSIEGLSGAWRRVVYGESGREEDGTGPLPPGGIGFYFFGR